MPCRASADAENASVNEALFLDLYLTLSKDTVLPNFMTNVTILFCNGQFHISDGDVSRCTSYGVDISQPIRFSRAYSHVANLNTFN